MNRRISDRGFRLDRFTDKLPTNGVAPVFIYGVAALVTAGSDFLLLPVLTRAISTEEYGRYALAIGVAAFASDLCSVWAASAFLRFAAAHANAEETDILRGNLLRLVLAMAVVCSLVLGLVAAAAIVFGRPELGFAFGAATLVIPLNSTVMFALSDFQAAQRPLSYLRLSALRFALSAILGIAAIIYVKDAAWAFLAGSTLGSAIAICPYARTVLRRRRGGVRPGELSRSFRFGSGVWLQNVGAKLLRIGDRFVIGSVSGEALAGIYSGGYLVYSGVTALPIAAIVQALTPSVFRITDKSGVSASCARLRALHELYVPLLAVLIAAAIVFVPILNRLLLPEPYLAEFSDILVVGLVIGSGIHGLTLTLNLAFGIDKNTITPGGFFLLFAALNIAINWALVPYWGIGGAVVANAICYAGLLAVTATLTQRRYSVLPSARVMILSVAGILISSAVFLGTNSESLVFRSLAGSLTLVFWGSVALYWGYNRYRLTVESLEQGM